MSKLAYWQSEALSRNLQAQVGSQSQISARQLVSCPSLLTAALVSDPSVVVVPLQQPPKRSAVSDWLQQQSYGQPSESKHTTDGNTASSKHTESKSTTPDLLPVDYGQPIDSKRTTEGNRASNKHTDSKSAAPDLLAGDYGQPTDSKHTLMPNKNTESINGTPISMESEQRVSQRRNDDDDDNNNDDGDDEMERKKKKRSLLRKRQVRVSFLTDVGQNKSNSVELVADERVEIEDEDDAVVDEKHSAAAARYDDHYDDGGSGGGGSQKLSEGKSPTSDSGSSLLCSQPSSSGRPLPKASFIDLEVPDSWRPRHQSQMSDGSRYSGSVHFPPVSATTPEAPSVTLIVASTPTIDVKSGSMSDDPRYSGGVDISPVSTAIPEAVAERLHVASTPTMDVKSGHSNELVDLSMISCSPITPRTTSDKAMKTESHEGRHFPAGVEAQKDHDNDDNVTVVPCSPLTPSTASNHQHDMKVSTHHTRSGTDLEGHHNSDDDDDITVIPCTPATPPSCQSENNSSCGKRLSASAELQQDDKVQEEQLAVASCSVVTPTTTSNQAVQNKPQRDIRRISRFKVLIVFRLS